MPIVCRKMEVIDGAVRRTQRSKTLAGLAADSSRPLFGPLQGCLPQGMYAFSPAALYNARRSGFWQTVLRLQAVGAAAAMRALQRKRATISAVTPVRPRGRVTERRWFVNTFVHKLAHGQAASAALHKTGHQLAPDASSLSGSCGLLRSHS